MKRLHDAPERDAHDPTAGAVVAAVLSLVCLTLAWIGLQVGGIELAYGWVLGGTVVLTLLAWRYPGNWLEGVWRFFAAWF